MKLLIIYMDIVPAIENSTGEYDGVVIEVVFFFEVS